MNFKLRLIAGTIAAVSFLGAGTAAARPCPVKIDLGGHGTTSVDEGWRYVLSGPASGKPFRWHVDRHDHTRWRPVAGTGHLHHR